MKRLELLETSGYSMEPLLKSGDRIVLSKPPFDTLKKGDLVLAEINGTKVCHRVTGIRHEGSQKLLLLRGDASYSTPDAVSENDYLGKISAIVKPGSTVFLETAAQRLLARLAICCFPLLMTLRRFLSRCFGR